jgi:hypothetical protein
MPAPLAVCAVCGRQFWPPHAPRRGPLACGPACAERLRRHDNVTAVLILATLAKPVDAGRARAWLCLQPVREGR